MNRSTKVLLSLSVTVIIAIVVWWTLSINTYWRSGNYRLTAIDSLAEMSLTFGGGSGEALVGPVVFAVGESEQYIVLKQHPPIYQNQGNDRTITNYFVVTRALNSETAAREENIRGPLSKAQFDKLAGRMALPPFSETFEELE